MPINSSVELPISTKDPREAVPKWIELIQTQAEGLEKAQIDLAISSMANNGVLIRLAERLPVMALGFKDRAFRDRSAGEFLIHPGAAPCVFQRSLTEYFSIEEIIPLLEELLRSPAQAIRSTSFSVNANDFRWRNSPGDSSGSLFLFDFKASFQRRKCDFHSLPI